MAQTKQLKTYRFYFSQVNQEVVEQKGYSIDACFRKAVKEWKQGNSNPRLLSAESLESKTWKEVSHD